MNKLPLTLFGDLNNLESGDVTGKVQLNGRGVSEAEIAASMNGRVFVNMQDVYLNSFQLFQKLKDISVFSMFSSNLPLSLPCLVVNVPVKNGLISSQNKMALKSNLANIQINGDINLSDETLRLNMALEPTASEAMKIMFNEVFLSGSLKEPVVKINKEKAFDKVLSVGMAFFVGGKTAAQHVMNKTSLNNVCAQALEKVVQ